MDLLVEKEHKILTSLPDVVVRYILNMLDAPDLQQLRLVSKMTKSWVEQCPSYLDKFTIHVNGMEILKELLKSSVEWTSFKIVDLSDTDTPEGNVFFSLFCNRFAPIMTNLNWHYRYSHTLQFNGNLISEVRSEDKMMKLLSKSTNLGSLSITNIGGNSSRTTLDTLIVENISRNIAKLKSLHIHYLEKHHMEGLFTFDFFLKNCPHLVSFSIPQIQCYSRVNSTITKKETELFIYQPLLEHLKRMISYKEKQMISYKQKQMMILGHPMLIINFQNNYRLNYVPDSKMVLEIIQLCSQTNAKLKNVPTQFIPKNDENLGINQKKMLDQCLMDIIVTTHMGLKNIYVPRLCPVQIKIIVEIESFVEFELQDENIETIHLIWIQPRAAVGLQGFGQNRGIQNLLNQLFQVRRPSVKEINIYRNYLSTITEVFPTGLEISLNFPNLVVLYLEHFGETNINLGKPNHVNTEDFNSLLRGLPKLKELTFSCCRLLTDDGLLGTDYENPLIVQLKNLTYLRIWDCSITHLSFNHGFSYMKLKSFRFGSSEYKSFIDPVAQVAMTDAISKLGSIKNGLHNSLLHMELLLPLEFLRKDIEQHLKYEFQNIRSIHVEVGLAGKN